MPWTKRTGAAALVLTLLCVGCAALEPTAQPDLTLVDLRISDVTLFETSAEFTLRISNENPDPLKLQGGAFKIDLQGIKVGKGLMSQAVEVPGFDSVTVDVPVHISHLALASRLRSVLEGGKVSYRLRATLYRETAMGRRRLRSVGSGIFDLSPQAPQTSP